MVECQEHRFSGEADMPCPDCLQARIKELEADKALLDWADEEGHHDLRYPSLRDELRDKGGKLEAGFNNEIDVTNARIKELEAFVAKAIDALTKMPYPPTAGAMPWSVLHHEGNRLLRAARSC